MARALTDRDAAAVAALFAPGGRTRVVEDGTSGRVRATDAEAAHDVLTSVMALPPGAAIEVVDLVAGDGRIACVFAVRTANAADASAGAIVPAFARIRHGLIDEIALYLSGAATGEEPAA